MYLSLQNSHKDKDKDKDSFIGPQEFAVRYSKAPEQPQSCARPICHSHTMTSTGRELATIRIAAYRRLPRYALRHGRRHMPFMLMIDEALYTAIQSAKQHKMHVPVHSSFKVNVKKDMECKHVRNTYLTVTQDRASIYRQHP